MLGRSLSWSISLVTLLLMGLISTGVHYMTRKIARGPEYSVGVYVSDMIGQIRVCAKNCVEIPKVKDMLPVTPQGWTSRDFDRADLPLVTGIAPKPETDPNNAVTAETVGASGMLALAVAGSMYSADINRRATTYIKGDEIVIFSITYKKAALFNGIGGDQLAMMFAVQNMIDQGTPYVRVDDLVFELKPEKNDGAARRFVANYGTQLDFEVLTNATDESFAEILKGLDIAGLKLMLSDHPSNQGVEVPAATAVDEQQAPIASAGAGFLKGLFGSEDPPAAAAAAEVAAQPDGTTTKPEAGFAPSCSGDKGFKHCDVAAEPTP
jgi:hypothetical protein